MFTQKELDEHWQHASPGGGFVTSEWQPAITLAPGQVIERGGRWVRVERESTDQRWV